MLVNKSTLLYDDECPFCLRFAQAIERSIGHDKITQLSVHGPGPKELFPDLDLSEIHDIVHLIDPEGNIHKGPEVALYLAKEFPFVSKFSWLLETNAGKKGLDFFYKKANEYRKKALAGCKGC